MIIVFIIYFVNVQYCALIHPLYLGMISFTFQQVTIFHCGFLQKAILIDLLLLNNLIPN